MIGRLVGGMLGIMALMGGGILVATIVGVGAMENMTADPSDPGKIVWMGLLTVGGPIIVVTLIGIFASRWLFGRVLSGDSKLLTGGLSATGVVKEVRDTGTTINDVNAIFEVVMDVTVPGKPAYEAKTQIMLNRTQWGSLQLGMVLNLKVDPADPSKVAVDPGGGAGTASQPIIQVPGLQGARRIEGTRSSDDIIAQGERGIGVILAVSDTGKTVGEMAPAGSYPAERANDPLIYVSMRVEPEVGEPYQAESLFRAPRDQLADLTIGARVPIAHIPGDQNSATIDWDRL